MLERMGERIAVLIAAFFLIIASAPALRALAYDCAEEGHLFDTSIVDATENAAGSITYTCRACGYAYSEAIPAYGHAWSGWITDVAATCTAGGLQHRVCSGCGQTEEQTLPARGHRYVETDVAPTCTRPGAQLFVCADCGATDSVPAAEALGHDYGEWVTDVAPQPGIEGHRYCVCSRDASHILEQTIPPLPVPEPQEEEQRPVKPNTLDYVLCSLEAVLLPALAVGLASQKKLLRWDKELERKNRAGMEQRKGN